MSTYSDAQQRDLDQRSGEALDRHKVHASCRPSARELAEHYAWNGPLARWVIECLAEDDPT